MSITMIAKPPAAMPTMPAMPISLSLSLSFRLLLSLPLSWALVLLCIVLWEMRRESVEGSGHGTERCSTIQEVGLRVQGGGLAGWSTST